MFIRVLASDEVWMVAADGSDSEPEFWLTRQLLADAQGAKIDDF